MFDQKSCCKAHRKKMNTVTWHETNNAHNKVFWFVTVSSGSSSWHSKVTVTSSSWNAWALWSFKVQELLAQWHSVTCQTTWISIGDPGRTSTLAFDTYIYQLHTFISCLYLCILPLSSKDNLCSSCIVLKIRHTI